MHRSIRPTLEALEGKAPLSAGAGVSPGLADSITAVAVRTPSGVQVAETFTVTNVSDRDIRVIHGPTDDGFTVTEAGKTVFNPDAGVLPFFLEVDDLEPHQSLTVRNTWDGRSNLIGTGEEGPPLSGTFAITDGLDRGGPSATVTIPPSGAMPPRPSHLVPPKPAPQVPVPAHVVRPA